jgi:uncharacterized SAM-binding protein YcdF (DUF218 family)
MKDIKKIKSIVCAIFFLLFLLARVETVFSQPDAGYSLILPQKTETKNFYFLSLLRYFNEVDNLFHNDKELQSVAIRKQAFFSSAANHQEILQAMRFSEAEIATVSARLNLLYRADNALGKIATSHLVLSGCYYLYKDLPDKELLVKAWEQDARSINRIIDIYGEGQKPLFPAIDSISFVRNSRSHQAIIKECQSYLNENIKDNKLFYTLPFEASILLLDLNDRKETVDFEPLSETVNQQSYEYIRSIDWDKYRYSLILILGAGPSDYETQLSPEGKTRLRMAALKYRQGVAPLIVVSGGRVHPYKTRNNEAFFMKKYLMEECNIPEQAIIMEPHARHTTSNVRNCVRIMFRRGIPMDKCALISSSQNHITSVAANAFAERCLKEMGIKPYELGTRIADHFVEFYPRLDALQINPLEPLDP